MDKAIKAETKAARKLNDATHKHDVSITDQHKAEHARDLRHRSLADTDRNLTQHKAALDDAQRIKDTHEVKLDITYMTLVLSDTVHRLRGRNVCRAQERR